MNTYIRIDKIETNPNYNDNLDKEWDFTVTMVYKDNQTDIETRTITIHRLAAGFDRPHLSAVIARIEKCKTFEEVIEVGQNKPTNSAYDKYKAWTIVKTREAGEKAIMDVAERASLEGVKTEKGAMIEEVDKQLDSETQR